MASAIQSIQYGSIVASTSGVTATITSVVVANSVVLCLGMKADAANVIGRLVLTNATTVTGTSSNGAPTLYFVVVEFAAGQIKSNQDFSIALSGVSSNTATITSVSTTKTVLLWRGYAHDTNDNLQSLFIGMTLTNATTVTANRTAADVLTANIYGTALEFN